MVIVLCSILFATNTISDSAFVFLLSSLSTMYKVRALAVSCINYGGYKLYPYPLEDLSKLLMMKVKFFSLALVPSCFVEISTLMFGHQTCVIDCVFFRNQIWIPYAVIVVLRPPQMK